MSRALPLIVVALALALALALPTGSFAAAPASVRRENLAIKVKVSGTVVADDVFRIRSTIEGRVENVQTSTYVWRTPDQALALIANRELAAMRDARGAQDESVIEERWKRVFLPTPAKCSKPCFILKNFLKPRTWIKPDSVMFEAAGALKLVARAKPEVAQWIREGQTLTFRPVGGGREMTVRVARFLIDADDKGDGPGGTLTALLSPERSLDPGTVWEGEIVVLTRRKALTVPTGSIIRSGGVTYLPVRVSTGVTTDGLTEIAGVEEGRGILVLDDAELRGAARNRAEVDVEGLRRRAEAQRDGRDPDAEPVRRARGPEVVEQPDYGEDPYSDIK